MHTMEIHYLCLIFLLFSKFGFVDSHEKTELAKKQAAEKAEKRRIAQNKRHLRKHLKDIGFKDDETIDMFMRDFPGATHFFMLHDFDRNSKLDGLEILQGLWHEFDHDHDDDDDDEEEHEHDHKKTKQNERTQPEPLNEAEDLAIQETDKFLEIADRDNNGYIDYLEFISHLSYHELFKQAESEPK